MTRWKTVDVLSLAQEYERVLKVFSILLMSVFCADRQALGLELTSPDFGTVDVSSQVEAFYIPEARWSDPIGEAQTLPFVPVQDAQLQNVREGVVWLKLDVENRTADVMPVYLTTRHYFYNLQLYELVDGALVLRVDGSFDNRNTKAYKDFGSFAQKLSLSQGQNTFFLKLQRKVPRSLYDWRLISNNEFRDLTFLDILIKGLLLGIYAGLTLYIFCLTVQFQKKELLYYLLYMASYIFAFSFSSYFILQTLRTPFVVLYFDEVVNVTAALSVALALMFTVHFLELKQRAPWLRTLCYIFVGALVVSGLAIALVRDAATYPISRILILTSGPFILLSGLYVSLAFKLRSAQFFTLGWSCLIVGASVTVMGLLDWIPSSLWTHWGSHAGVALEMIVLCFAISDQFRQDQVEKNKAITELNTSLVQTNHKLEESLLDLDHSIRSRTTMVKDLAHRGNNPLQSFQLTLDQSQLDLDELRELWTNLLGESSQLDEDGKKCWQKFENLQENLEKDRVSLAFQVQRIAAAIREIRTLSGVDGITLERLSWSDLLSKVQSRLEETLGETCRNRLLLEWRGEASRTELWSNEVILLVCLERWMRFLLETTTDPLVMTCSVVGTAFQCSLEQKLELSQSLFSELLAELNYSLRSVGSEFSCQITDSGLKVSLIAI